MKKMWLAGVALGASLAFAGTAPAQDISVGVAGPMTGAVCLVRHAAQERRRSRGRRHQRRRRRDGQEAQARGRRRRLRSEAGARGRPRSSPAKLPFVAGHYCSSSSIPASEAYQDGGVLQITPASTNPTFTERNMWNTFRVCGRDDQQGTVAGDYVAKTYKGKNIAILHDKSTYGKGLADEMKKALNKAGVKEKMYEAYTQGRQGLQLAGLEDEGQQDRRGLCRRLPHRGRPDPAPDARPGHDQTR